VEIDAISGAGIGTITAGELIGTHSLSVGVRLGVEIETSRAMNADSGSNCCINDRHERWFFLLDNPIRRLLRRPRRVISRYLRRRQVAADLGCGPGFFTASMAEILGPEGRVYAVDSDEKAIEALKRKTSKKGYTTVDARAQSASDLTFIPDHSVDFILANLLLCCVMDHAGVVREVKRILRATGTAYLSVVRAFRTKDPRAVSKTEWKEILDGFRLIEQGAGLTTRWAAVSPKESSGSIDIGALRSETASTTLLALR